MTATLDVALRALPVLSSVAELRRMVAAWRDVGQRIALVPTMGALHDGHLSLVHRARQKASRVVVSIFVNPTQFGPGEDFSAYPRQEAADAVLLAKAGADAIFMPTVDEMYPGGFATNVHVAGLTDGLCGPFRPGHFDGVATVVSKLLLQARPDVALFGEKDYQQLLVIKRAVTDLDIGVIIEGVPTMREADGLAMSSRNAYLTPAERRIAPTLYRVLGGMAARIADGADPRSEETRATQDLLQAGFASVDYVHLCDAETLARPLKPGRPGRLLAAAKLGRARLIDNVPVGPRG
jgi:pantoate--beta-alanine ligase